MKKTVPLVIGMMVGLFALAEFYIPHHSVGALQERFLDWALILSAAAFVLGGINIIQVNYPKIKRRDPDWQFKVALLASALIMGIACVKWHAIGGEASPGKLVMAAAPTGVSADAPGQIQIKSTNSDAIVKIGEEVRRADGAVFTLPAGTYPVLVYMKATGYAHFSTEVELTPGGVATIEADPYMTWGAQGRLGAWLYDHVFAPCNATMFALLAFFIASAAFRAFRARNVEAALLLGAAILILLGRAPIGRSISQYLPEIADWILDIPNNAGRRAIMMGAALGGIATGLRVILGLERSHLGSD
jgi:hypothetical protein